MNKNNPIGIFDSGVGGLTVLKELATLMPDEDYIYLADSANCPYGSKSDDEIFKLSKKNSDFLLSKNCKIIIVACNTATAAAIDKLRNLYTIPFVGMEPAVKPAAQNTNTGKIGILATQGTFNGKLFKETSKKYTQHIETIVQVGEGLVELVESDNFESKEAEKLLAAYITPMIDENVDKIVLGCTHYPFFTPLIKKLTSEKIEIINPAPAIAKRTKFILEKENLLNTLGSGEMTFFNTGPIETLQLLATKLLNISTAEFKEVTLYTS